MSLNKQKGNMYGFVTHTWNAIKGKCSHDCSYCYMRPFWRSEVHLDEKELKTNLGVGNFIFVGSGTDMFADNIPDTWIKETLKYCKKYNNTYLFQTKNPKRFEDFEGFYPEKVIFGTTLETNYNNNLAKAPIRVYRFSFMVISFLRTKRRMVTIEPIMDFDLEDFVQWFRIIKPEFVNIGADSKGHNLPEPSSEKIGQLIKELEKFTKVNLKPNLKRLYPK